MPGPCFYRNLASDRKLLSQPGQGQSGSVSVPAFNLASARSGPLSLWENHYKTSCLFHQYFELELELELELEDGILKLYFMLKGSILCV